MTIELTMLALAVALGLVQIVLSAQTKNLQTGYRWAAGPRDEARPPLSGIAGRLERALSNFLETFPLFAAAILIAHVAGRHDWMTVWGAQLYLWARVLYVPLYISGRVSFTCRSTLSGFPWSARSPGTWRRSASSSFCCRWCFENHPSILEKSATVRVVARMRLSSAKRLARSA